MTLSGKHLSSRTMQILKTLYDKGNPRSVRIVEIKQDQLAKELGISRQALNAHLKKLREAGYIKTGRGFIEILDEGAKILGASMNPSLILVKVAPKMRSRIYKEILNYPVIKAFRVAGDMDLVILVEEGLLGEMLQKLASIEGVESTKSYITIQVLK